MKKVLPQTIFNLSLLLIFILHFTLPLYIIITYPWNLLGLILLIIGVTLNLVADKSFKKSNTTVKPFDKSTKLVVNGVFNISRNPMYLGMSLLHIGVCILLGSLSPFIIPIVFIIIIDRRFIKTEEKMLGKQFQNQWLDYKNNVRRWI